MPRLNFTLSALLIWINPVSAHAEIARTIASSRVLLGDLVPTAPADLASLDLGPAPPAGSSRLYSPEDLAAATRQVGRSFTIKESIRAVRATKRWSQADLLATFTAKLEGILPEYAKLVRVEVPKTLVTGSNVELTGLQLGQLPNRRGSLHTSVVAELGSQGNVEQRLTLPVILDLASRPKPVEVDRGTTVTLVINLGSTRVTAAATLLQPATIGSTALFRVVKTRKALQARLLTPSTAEVVRE